VLAVNQLWRQIIISDISEASYSTQWCSVAEAMKLITHPFDGSKKELREFIENMDLVLNSFIQAKIKYIKTKFRCDILHIEY
jgi:hypothetical protein